MVGFGGGMPRRMRGSADDVLLALSCHVSRQLDLPKVFWWWWEHHGVEERVLEIMTDWRSND
jgi:hypothetical protein